MALLLTLALLLAVGVSAARLVGTWSRRRQARRQPGACVENAIPVSSFDEIDDKLGGRVCGCGGQFKVLGEGSAGDNRRRIRVVRLECSDCESLGWIHFDVTEAYQ